VPDPPDSLASYFFFGLRRGEFTTLGSGGARTLFAEAMGFASDEAYGEAVEIFMILGKYNDKGYKRLSEGKRHEME
jgi:hypothetical protein